MYWSKTGGGNSNNGYGSISGPDVSPWKLKIILGTIPCTLRCAGNHAGYSVSPVIVQPNTMECRRKFCLTEQHTNPDRGSDSLWQTPSKRNRKRDFSQSHTPAVFNNFFLYLYYQIFSKIEIVHLAFSTLLSTVPPIVKYSCRSHF